MKNLPERFTLDSQALRWKRSRDGNISYHRNCQACHNVVLNSPFVRFPFIDAALRKAADVYAPLSMAQVSMAQVSMPLPLRVLPRACRVAR